MDVGTSLHGRLRNTTLAYSHGLLPVFEAVVNAIHAIEEAALASEVGRVQVAVERTPTLFDAADAGPKKGRKPTGDIVSFTITDNGIGFTDPNFQAFLTLDTEHKASKGGRGIGRLLWLKAFQRAEITSHYADGSGGLQRRRFTFDGSGVDPSSSTPAETDAQRGSSVRLIGFQSRYRQQAKKTGESIAQAILEHCLWYFIRAGGAPRLEVTDDGETTDLNQLFDAHMHASAVREEVHIKGTPFELLHVKLRAKARAVHSVAYCADNRLVTQDKLAGVVPGLQRPLNDETGTFVYGCYVSSDLLDSCVRPERNAFDLPDEPGDLFADTDISWRDIHNEVHARAAHHLTDALVDVRLRARDRVHSYIAHKAPRYKPIEDRLASVEVDIDPEIADKDLEIALHKQLAELERELLSAGHDVMVPKLGESEAEYRRRIQEYLKAAEDLKKSDLANYVAHRRVVLDLLELALQREHTGKYAREDVLHRLIMPMRVTSTEVPPDGSNLWLLDERLAFHDFLASDKTISAMPITSARDTKEPDLLALHVFDNPVLVSEGPTLPLASIVVVEIKRPMRNDAASGEEDDPIEQALGYLDRVRSGQVMTATGRPIPASAEIPGFCYVVCDITPSIEARCKVHDLTRTSDGMGYFAYKRSFGAYVEVISFDRLVNAAKQRNRAFFDKLGLPTR